MTTYVFSGSVVNLATRAGVPDVTVEAWDVDHVVPEAIGVAVTDDRGNFQLRVDAEHVARMFPDRQAVAYFTAREGAFQVATTERAMTWNVIRAGRGVISIDTTSRVGTGTAASSVAKASVEGRVTSLAGELLGGLSVEVFVWQASAVGTDPPGIQKSSVGSTTTDDNGNYRVEYVTSVRPDLSVVVDAGGPDETTATVFAAPPRAHADIVVGGEDGDADPGPTKFGRLPTSFADIEAKDFTDAQVEFVARRLEVDSDEVDHLRAAAQLNETHSAVPAEVFFGLFRQGLPATGGPASVVGMGLFRHRLPTLRAAIEKAIADRTIAAEAVPDIDALMGDLETAAVTALRASVSSNDVPLGKLVDNAPSVSEPAATAFIKKVLNSTGSADDFWADVDSDSAFTPDERRRLKFATLTAAVSGFFYPLVGAVHARVVATTLEPDLDALAALDVSDWDDIILESNVEVGGWTPPGTPGDTQEERRANYAKQVALAVESRLRTSVIRARVAAAEPTSDLKTFLDDNASYDFMTDRLEKYLLANPTALDGIADPEDKAAVKARIQGIERVSRIASQWSTVKVLMDAGFMSARDIHVKGKKAFFETIGGALDESVLDDVFNQTCWAVDTSIALGQKLNVAFESPHAQLPVLPNKSVTRGSYPPGSKIGDWATLFGSADACACEHCRSVLGPAAYLVDLFLLLSRHPKTTSGTALTELFTRRADLPLLALNCENADTALPYVDLVNEILEVRAAGGAWPSSPDPVTTSRETADLLAMPETIYPTKVVSAYRALAAANYPFNLPFHVWQEEARVYLAHLGVTRQKLIELFAPVSGGPSTRHLALERLGTTGRQFDIISGPPAGGGDPPLNEYWGVESGDWPASLASVPTFLAKAQLSYDELLELLATKTCTDSPAVALDSESTCVVAEQTLTGITEARLTKIMRLLRLRRVLGWSITDTDRAFTALGGLDSDTELGKLAGARELQARFSTGATEVLAWYSGMDRQNRYERSLFEEVYLDPRVAGDTDTLFQAVFDTDTSSTPLTDVRSTLLSALGLKDAELSVLIDSATAGKLWLEPTFPSSTFANRESLSRLYRIRSFAKRTGLGARKWLLTQALSGLPSLEGDNAGSATPDDTLAFLRMIERLDRSPLSLDEIHWLLRNVEPDGEPISLGPDVTDAIIKLTDAAIVSAASGALNLADPDGELLLGLAKPLLTLEQVGWLVKLAADTLDGTGGDPTQEDFIIDVLTPYVGGDAAAADVVAALTGGSPSVRDPKDRSGYLASRFQRYVASGTQVVAALAGAFGLDAAVTRLALTQLLTWDGGPALHAFLPGDEWSVALAPPEDRKELIARLAKVRLFVVRHGMTAAEIEAINASTLPSINFNALPVVAPVTTSLAGVPALFGLVLRWSDYVWVRDQWPGDRTVLLAAFASAATADVGNVLASVELASGWSLDDMTIIADRLGYPDDAQSDAFKDERPFYRIGKAIEALKRLGVSAKQAISWLNVEIAMPTSTTTETGPNALTVAASIRKAAAAKHSKSAWGEVARPLRNALREKQRDGLVGYLIAELNLASADDLYDSMFIDVQMDPCMLTSRLVLAHSSVQSFVQRILLNLEIDQNLVPRDDTADQWRWMKNYRIWEANRKVFLWPENWVEPELRGDKSPIFKTLERRLLSGPLDGQLLESAIRAYLDEMADVANLEIVGMCTEPLATSTNPFFKPRPVTHVFGRIPGTRRYYRRARAEGTWSPWEKVDVDIKGDNLMPFVFGDRLFLAWAALEDVDRTRLAVSNVEVYTPGALYLLGMDQFGSQPALAEKPQQMQTRVRVEVSELRGDVWSHPQPSEWWELGVAPVPALVAVKTNVATDHVQFDVHSYGRRVAKLVFYPGTHRFVKGSSSNVGRLEDAAGQYKAPSYTVYKPGYNAATDVEDFAPDGLYPHYQWFKGSVDELTLFLNKYNTPDGAQSIVTFENDSYRRIIAPRLTESAMGERDQLVLQDGTRSFFMEIVESHDTIPVGTTYGTTGAFLTTDHYYRFTPFYHAYVDSFRNAFARAGLDGLYRNGDIDLQAQSADLTATGPEYELDAENVETPFPMQTVDFTHGSPYAIYNWELFFHVPFLVAVRLMGEGRYEEARDWFHYIFDPTIGADGTDATRYWRFAPFAENTDLSTIQEDLDGSAASAAAQELDAAVSQTESAAAQSLRSQIAAWRADPFDPHLIARLRMVTYQKTVVMRYIDNLLAWADSLFSQDTIESVNEATQLYVLASKVLGRRPIIAPEPTPPVDKSYGQIEDMLDAFGNALVDVELVGPKPIPKAFGLACSSTKPPPLIFGSSYFCVPPNEKLIAYWDVVADRLFKIRNCQNIEGVTRVLPLFQPPIDPALLVRAKALGVDLSKAVFEQNVATPPYRYSVLYGKAVELASAVSGFGQTYLSTLEKQDAEELSLLRSSHETAMQSLMLESRRIQLREAQESLRATERSRVSVQQRFEYYSTRALVSGGEQQALDDGEMAHRLELGSQLTRASGALAAAVIDSTAGAAGLYGSPVEVITYGGGVVGRVTSLAADAVSAAAGAYSHSASVSATLAGYHRRMDDWKLQAKNAKAELDQIDKQILAAQIRVEIAEHDVSTAETQIEQSKAVDDFLKRKFTNFELYGFMKDRLAAVYYQGYQVAYEAARRAQKAFQYERGDSNQSFIGNEYWISGRNGLLAGEQLLRDLRAMDAAYVAQNTRELELTKTVALSQHDPAALVELLDGNSAPFGFIEDDFDRDFPTHYMRRLKSVTVTVPCSVGPYQGVLGKLSLTKAATRPTKDATDLVEAMPVVESIATSQGQGDTGLFSFDFRDERYLPFEGAGAHLANTDPTKNWSFELSPGTRFARDNVSDVILELRYTAREGRDAPTGFAERTFHRLVDVEEELGDAWQLFKSGVGSTGNIIVPIPEATWDRNETERASGDITITRVTVEGWWADDTLDETGDISLDLDSTSLAGGITDGRGTWQSSSVSIDVDDSTNGTFTIPGATLVRQKLKKLWIIFDYTIS